MQTISLAKPQLGPGAAGHEVLLAMRLPRDRSAPRIARRAVGGVAARVAGPTRDDLLLVVSELVTNALMHGTGEIELRIAFDGRRIRGEVNDEGVGFECDAKLRRERGVGGNGLHLVGAVADRWGVRERSGRVWFELATA